MNKRLQDFARAEILGDLAKCTAAQNRIFIAMYGPGKTLDDLQNIVGNMPAEKLDWAMTQVRNTVIKNEKEQPNGR